MSSQPPDDDDDRTVIPPRGRASNAARPPDNPTRAASSAGHSGNALPIGTYLDEFELTGVIGEGGFGIVYQAWDHTLQRRVALKEYMPASLAAREQTRVQVRSERHRETFDVGLRSFVNEARLLAQFDHPALLKVYRFWEANGTAYMVMPLLQGITLKDKLKQLGQPPDEAWLRALLGPLTAALQVLHAEHCYHRDIAADNVLLLDGSGAPLLLDFGAARRVIGDMTQALTVILKPGYAPIEQYAEVPHMKQGPWTDVYALAALVHLAITGKTPPPSVSRIVHDDYVPLERTVAGRYSAGFLRAIDQALQVRPEQRTQSIEALRADLGLDATPGGTVAQPGRHAAATSVPTAPAAPGVVPTGAGAASRRSALGLGVAALVLAAASVAGYLALSSGRGKPSQVTTPAVQPQTTPQPPAITAAPAAPATPAPARPPSVPQHFDVREQINQVMAGQSAVFGVTAQAATRQLRIGRDALSFTVSSARDGYVQVLLFGPDGSLMLLFPNAQASDNRIKAGQTLKLPQASWPLETAEPTGPEQFLVIVSAAPRDYSELSQEREYIFLKLPTQQRGAELAARWTRSTPLLLGSLKSCTETDCDVYGAAQFSVEVVH
ncbi:MAG: hypothetical protein RLY71_4451 [Pseudomonadota bacterium]